MAVTTVTTIMAGAINYTHVTDTSADWASVPNSTYFYDKADKLVHYKNGTGSILEVFSAGGLTYFTEAQNSSAPNATVNVDSLTAIASTTNADFVIKPKGTGAFILAIPDSTSTGGNKRGANSVDLQTDRTLNTEVSSGGYSVNLGGSRNTSSGGYSVNIGGYQNSSGGNYAIAGGYLCTASGQQSVSLGASNTASNTASVSLGASNTSSGNYSIAMGQSCTASFANSVAIGYQCTASGGQSVAIGYNASATSSGPCVSLGYQTTANAIGSLATGKDSHTFGVYGRHVHSPGKFETLGDAQKSTFILRRRTTDAISTILTTEGSGAVNASNYVSLQNNNVFRFKGSIVGKQTGTTNVGVWDIDGVIVRGANAASTTLTISNINLVTNASGWGTPTLTTDTTYGSLVLNVIGLAGTNIQWTALVETTEVIY